MNKRVAVLVLNYNGLDHLQVCFQALQAQQYTDFDAFLIDNASQDGSCEFVQVNFPWVNVLRMPENYGFSAYNRVVASINHELIALLNNDTKVEPMWLFELVRAIEQDEGLSACTSKMVFMDEPWVINHAGGAITVLGLGYDIGFGQRDGREFAEPKYVGSFSGGAALIRRQIFQAVGGFDESYFAYFEDVDLSWRFALQGYKVLYVPTAVVQHKFGASFGPRGSLLREYLCERNRWANLIKNVSAYRLPVLLVASFGFHMLKLFEHLLLGRIAHADAVFRGLRDTLRRLPSLIQKRHLVQASRRVSDQELSARGTLTPLLQAARERRRLGWANYLRS